MKTLRSPKATRLSETQNQTQWRIDWPNSNTKIGKTYLATTYTNSDIISIWTAAKERRVSALVGSKIMPMIKQAISEWRMQNEGDLPEQ